MDMGHTSLERAVSILLFPEQLINILTMICLYLFLKILPEEDSTISVLYYNVN